MDSNPAMSDARSFPASLLPSTLLLLLWGVWWGGLTLYAAIVVPIGTQSVGSIEQGFITQRVTGWLNAIGIIMVLSMGLFSLRSYRNRRGLFAMATLEGILLVALMQYRVRLTNQMDYVARDVADGFYHQHAIYLWLTTLQWLLGLAIPIFILKAGMSVPLRSSR